MWEYISPFWQNSSYRFSTYVGLNGNNGLKLVMGRSLPIVSHIICRESLGQCQGHTKARTLRRGRVWEFVFQRRGKSACVCVCMSVCVSVGWPRNVLFFLEAISKWQQTVQNRSEINTIQNPPPLKPTKSQAMTTYLPCMTLMQTCLMCWSVGALPWTEKTKASLSTSKAHKEGIVE